MNISTEYKKPDRKQFFAKLLSCHLAKKLLFFWQTHTWLMKIRANVLTLDIDDLTLCILISMRPDTDFTPPGITGTYTGIRQGALVLI